MIVENKEELLVNAHLLTNGLIKQFNSQLKEYSGNDDPGEIIYFTMHVLGNFTSRILSFIENAVNMYGSDVEPKKWLDLLIEEYSNANNKEEEENE